MIVHLGTFSSFESYKVFYIYKFDVDNPKVKYLQDNEKTYFFCSHANNKGCVKIYFQHN